MITSKGNIRTRTLQENYRYVGVPSSLEYSTDKKNDGRFLYGVSHGFGLFVIVAFLSYAVVVSDTFLPKSKTINVHPEIFSGERARKYLVGLTNIGNRPFGSYENDILAVDFILKELLKIKENANAKYHIEVELQHASGSFGFFREKSLLDGLGFTAAYDNLTNVLVKLSVKKNEDTFVLANAHFDTVPNTVGASDDAVSCALLIEIFRALSVSDPDQLKHGVMFLFNGAEEGILAGSHAFVDKHQWAKIVKVVVNLEAAGSGGREFVFQTGPDHPWILNTYAESAKYPFASVFAQEIFELGIIPSDTDYRIFVQYGNLIGLDLAFISNGYIYHTKYDTAAAIPSGSIQRAGDNVLSLIKKLVNSPYLKDAGQFKHGSTVYFDVLGMFMVRYPKRLHVLLNNMTCIVVGLYIFQRLIRKKFSSMKEHVGLRSSIEHFNAASVVIAMLVILVSYVIGILYSVGTACILTKMNVKMCWYSKPLSALFLYGLPTLFGMLKGHYMGHLLMKKVTYPSISSFIYAHLILYSTILAIINQYEIKSTFLLWLWLISSFLLLCIPHDHVQFIPEMRANGVFGLHLLAFLPPAVVTMYHVKVLYVFFGPLLGRMGTELPTDIALAVASSVVICVLMTNLMNIYHGAFNMRRFLVTTGIAAFIPFLLALRYINPYSVQNGIITPKRLFMQHTHRRFYNSDQSIQKEDSGLWVQPMDYNGVDQLMHVNFYKQLKTLSCEGSYCGLPYYYPMRKIVRHQWYLDSEKPEVVNDPLSHDIYVREITDDGKIRYYFNIDGPDHMVMYLTVYDNSKLLDWSFYKTKDGNILSTDSYTDPNEKVQFVFRTRGYHAGPWKFWMDFQIPKSNNELAEVGISRMYVHGKKSRSRFLQLARKSLPEYVCDNSWTSNYDSFVLT